MYICNEQVETLKYLPPIFQVTLALWSQLKHPALAKQWLKCLLTMQVIKLFVLFVHLVCQGYPHQTNLNPHHPKLFFCSLFMQANLATCLSDYDYRFCNFEKQRLRYYIVTNNQFETENQVCPPNFGPWSWKQRIRITESK